MNPETASIDQKEELTAQVRPYSVTDITKKSRSITIKKDARPMRLHRPRRQRDLTATTCEPEQAVCGCDQRVKGAMISFSNARVVVVAGSEIGRPLVHTLTRMGLEGVSLVANPDQAQQLCSAERADACLVV